MAAYPDTITVEFYNGTSWTDISSDVVSDLIGNDGFGSVAPDDRVATIGFLTFDLNNSSKEYSPMGGDAYRGLPTLTGWNRGAKLRVKIHYDNVTYIVWTGWIDKIDTDAGTWGNQRAHVTCVTWMDVATRFPMKASEILTNQTIDNAVTDILSRLTVAPGATQLSTGTNTFATVFDDVRAKTKAIAELNKLALSELGYIYLLNDGTLRVESGADRKGTRELDTIPSVINAHFLELENGRAMFLEDGSVLFLNMRELPQLSYSMQDMDIELSNDVINSAYVRAYPTRVDTSLQVLFQIGTSIPISANQRLHFVGYYANPNGGNQINGTNMQTPVATTDYQAWTGISGTGTDLTSSLTVTATYYGNSVDYVIVNGDTAGYITKLQARGYGIYRDNPVESFNQNNASVDAYGDSPIEFDQKYQSNTYDGDAYGKALLAEFKNPKSRINKASFLANTDDYHMRAFLNLNIGNLISIYENRSRLTKYVYIMARNFVISVGGIIHHSYALRESPSLLSGGLTSVQAQTNPGLNFGYLAKITDRSTRSLSLWVYPIADVPDTTSIGLMCWGTTSMLLMKQQYKLEFYSTWSNPGQTGIWLSSSGTLTPNAWNHIAVTYDRSNANNSPLLYVNGVLKSFPATSLPSGTPTSELGAEFIIGNRYDSAVGVYNGLYFGRMRDVRVYPDKILSQANVTALYNYGATGTLALTDGLGFQGLCLYTDDVSSSIATGTYYAGDNSSVPLIDGVYRYAGSPLTRRWFTVSGTSFLDSGVWYDAAWSQSLGKLITVGQASYTSTSGAIITSPNGLEWSQNLHLASIMYGICWSSDLGKFVAVGDKRMAMSTDAASWSQVTVTGTYTAAAWGASAAKFVAVGNNKRVAYSADGTSWNVSTVPSSSVDFNDVCWSETLGLFVAVGMNGGTSGNLWTSPDAINWTVRVLPVSTNLYGVTWSSALGMFVAVGGGSHSLILTSTDGVTWTQRTSPWNDPDPVSNIIYAVRWSDELGIFVAITYTNLGTSNTSFTSSDGINWTQVAVSTDTSWYGLAWASGLRLFVALSAWTFAQKAKMMLY